MRRKIAAVLAALAFVTATWAVLPSTPPPAEAQTVGQEQRCAELGVNCVCSEPLNTNQYWTDAATGGHKWDPLDTGAADKQCEIENTGIPSLKGVAIHRALNDLSGTNAAAVLGALPGGHAIHYVLRGPNGQAGLWLMGNWFDDPMQFKARTAYRWYRYYSPDYVFNAAENPGCDQHGKLQEWPMVATHYANPGIAVYNFAGWWLNGTQSAPDCCFEQGSVPTNDTLRGKWWRFEVIIGNRKGPGFYIQVYAKNVTDNLDEVLVFDVRRMSWWNNTLTPPSTDQVDQWKVSAYAQSPTPGACLGFTAFSHLMAAGWDTDTGQRIGRAYEIETGAPPPPPDITPPGAPEWRP